MADMFTGLDRREVIPHVWTPRPKDLPLDSQYAFKADFMNTNLRKIIEMIGKIFWIGIHYQCLEGSAHYGASDSTHCRLTIPSGYTELNDYLVIGDGTRIWRVQVTVADQIEFTDTQLISGTSGTANYDEIKELLAFMTLSKEKIATYITKNEIALGAHDDALHADDIRISDAIATTIKDLYDAFDLEHEANGKHSNGIIENAMLDKTDVMVTEGFGNKVRNGAFNLNEQPSVDFWEAVDTPGTFRANSNPCDVFPDFEMELGTAGIGKGARQLLKGCEKGYPLRLCFWAWGNAGGEAIKAMLNDDSSSAELEITLTTTPTVYYLTFTPVSQCNVYVRFVANTASSINFRIALATVAFGDIHSKPERSDKDVLYDAVHTMTFFCADPLTDGQFAGFTLEKDIKILRADAYVRTDPATDSITVRISDGATNYDIIIAIAANSGSNTNDQEYAASSAMTVSMIAGFAIDAADLTLVVQYRQN